MERDLDIPLPDVTNEHIAGQIILRLNTLIADPEVRVVVQEMLKRRIPVGPRIANHMTIQTEPGTDEGIHWLGILGLLNGLLGCVDDGASTQHGNGFIQAVFTEDGLLVRFERATPETTS